MPQDQIGARAETNSSRKSDGCPARPSEEKKITGRKHHENCLLRHGHSPCFSKPYGGCLGRSGRDRALYSFLGGSDGSYPHAGLIVDKEGALYGTTPGGGSGCPQNPNGCGTVFRLTPPTKGQAAWTETVLYSFKGGSDGAGPSAGLIADKEGALYGTTAGGGGISGCPFPFSAGGCGTVFKLTPPANGQTWTETVLYRFCSQPGCSDGANPSAGLIADKEGALYGTTGGGSGCPQNPIGCGTVFRLTPPTKGQAAWTETVLYSFKGGSDGSYPHAGLIVDKEGALYGTTGATVFKLTPPPKGQTAWKETVLYRFCSQPSCSDGASPFAGLTADEEGALYGTTVLGGSFSGCPFGGGCGTVFKLTPPAKGQTAWTETVLHRFCAQQPGCSDGALPQAGLIADKQGALYGTTAFGGPYGTVFKLTPPAKGQTAWRETLLYSFLGFSGGGSDGANPLTLVWIADKEGALYGTTLGGGSGNVGTVYKLNLCPEPKWNLITHKHQPALGVNMA